MSSFLYNPRRTEDFTHPLWNEILIQLCQQASGRLIPTPQFRIYVSPLDASQPPRADLSIETTADREARGVITDFCVLMPFLELLESGQEILNDKSLGRQKMDFTSYFIKTLHIPLLVELKRPLSRNLLDVEHYVKHLNQVMTAAQDQVTKQASCLFGSIKYASQTSVLLIAAVGEWWSLTVIARDPRGYKDEAVLAAKASVYEDKSDALESAHEEEWDTKLQTFGPVTFQEMNVERQAKERNERAERRAERQERNLAAELALENFLEVTPARNCSEEVVNEYYRLKYEAKDINLSRYESRVGLLPTNGKITRASIAKTARWTSWMRIGGTASDAYMEFIENELKMYVTVLQAN